MATKQSEADTRADLVERLHALGPSENLAKALENGSLSELREMVEAGEKQRAFYAECGFEDMAASK